MGQGLFSVPALFWRQIMDEAKIFSDAEMLKLAMPNMKSPYLLREYSLASIALLINYCKLLIVIKNMGRCFKWAALASV